MQITTKELRIAPGKIIDQVAKGQEVTVTYRGKILAKIVPFQNTANTMNEHETSIFGLWSDRHEELSVDDYVREIRKGRQF